MTKHVRHCARNLKFSQRVSAVHILGNWGVATAERFFARIAIMHHKLHMHTYSVKFCQVVKSFVTSNNFLLCLHVWLAVDFILLLTVIDFAV